MWVARTLFRILYKSGIKPQLHHRASEMISLRQAAITGQKYDSRWLTHSPATLDVTGSRPTRATFLRFIFSSRQVSDTEGIKMVCVTLQELTVTSNVCGDNW